MVIGRQSYVAIVNFEPNPHKIRYINRLSWYFKSTTETLEKGVKYVQSQQ